MNLMPSASSKMLQLVEEQINCFARMKELQDQILLLNNISKPPIKLSLNDDKTDAIASSTTFCKFALDEKDDHLLMMLETMKERATQLGWPAKPDSAATDHKNCGSKTVCQHLCSKSCTDGLIIYKHSRTNGVHSPETLVTDVDDLVNENEQVVDEIYEIELCTEQIQARIYQLETWLAKRRRQESCELVLRHVNLLKAKRQKSASCVQ